MSKNLDQRRNEIIKLVSSTGQIKTKDLALYFDVSTETIRSDLKYLEGIGYVTISHGGASITKHVIHEVTDNEAKSSQHRTEKISIAECALSFIPENSIIYLDGGSTLNIFSELILTHKSNIKIVTPSLLIISTIMKSSPSSISLYMIGGYADFRNMMIRGLLIDEYRYAVAFLGTTGVKYHNGPTTGDFSEMQQKRQAIINSEKTIILCDHSKFNNGGITRFADWNEIDYLITDSNAMTDDIERIKKSAPRIQIITAELPETLNTNLY